MLCFGVCLVGVFRLWFEIGGELVCACVNKKSIVDCCYRGQLRPNLKGEFLNLALVCSRFAPFIIDHLQGF